MLTISTFNVQNDINYYKDEKTKMILDYLTKEKINVLNLQEVYSTLNKNLVKELSSLSYSINGKYRFFLKYLLKRFNEKTPIITNYKVLKTKTYHLPHFPSLLRRIITKVEIEDNNHLISIYNTHIDFQYESVKQRQLKKILKILKKDKNLIILTGDFNLKTNNPIFNDFIKELDKINIKHIDIKEKTFKSSKYHRAIDHIFISKDFKLIDKRLITNIPTSDHYPVLIQIDYQ